MVCHLLFDGREKAISQIFLLVATVVFFSTLLLSPCAHRILGILKVVLGDLGSGR
jgi:hypothetical protein